MHKTIDSIQLWPKKCTPECYIDITVYRTGTRLENENSFSVISNKNNV
jgi:hypothetical protein